MVGKFLSLSTEARGPFGITLLVMQMPFVGLRRTGSPSHFMSQLGSELGSFVFMGLLVGAFLLVFKIKNTPLETLRQGREERKQLGYDHYAWLLWRTIVAINIFAFVAMGLTYSSKLSYVQQLALALTAACCASLFHLGFVGFLDRWAQQPPPSNRPATEQVGWMFKDN